MIRGILLFSLFLLFSPIAFPQEAETNQGGVPGRDSSREEEIHKQVEKIYRAVRQKADNNDIEGILQAAEPLHTLRVSYEELSGFSEGKETETLWIEIVWLRGIAHMLLAQYPEAIADFRFVKSRVPNPRTTVFNNLAHALWNYGEKQKALKVLDEAEAFFKGTDLHNIYWNRGWYEYLLGNYEESLHYSEKCVDIFPSIPEPRFNGSLALFKQRKVREGFHWFFTALGVTLKKKDMKRIAEAVLTDLTKEMNEQPANEIYPTCIWFLRRASGDKDNTKEIHRYTDPQLLKDSIDSLIKDTKEKEIISESSMAKLLYLLGIFFEKTKEGDLAEEYLVKACRKDRTLIKTLSEEPDLTSVKPVVNHLILEKTSAAEVRRGDPESIVEAIDEIESWEVDFKKHSLDSRWHMLIKLRGRAHQALKQVRSAEKDYNYLIQQGTQIEKLAALLLLGDLYLTEGEFEKALNLITVRGITTMEKRFHPYLYYTAAEYLTLLERPDKRKEILAKADDYKDPSPFHLFTSLLHLMAGELDMSLAHFRVGIEGLFHADEEETEVVINNISRPFRIRFNNKDEFEKSTLEVLAGYLYFLSILQGDQENADRYLSSSSPALTSVLEEGVKNKEYNSSFLTALAGFAKHHGKEGLMKAAEEALRTSSSLADVIEYYFQRGEYQKAVNTTLLQWEADPWHALPLYQGSLAAYKLEDELLGMYFFLLAYNASFNQGKEDNFHIPSEMLPEYQALYEEEKAKKGKERSSPEEKVRFSTALPLWFLLEAVGEAEKAEERAEEISLTSIDLVFVLTSELMLKEPEEYQKRWGTPLGEFYYRLARLLTQFSSDASHYLLTAEYFSAKAILQNPGLMNTIQNDPLLGHFIKDAVKGVRENKNPGKAVYPAPEPPSERPVLRINPEGHNGIIKCMEFGREGEIITAGQDKTIRIWDIRTGSLKRTIRGEIGEGATGFIESLAVDSKGRYIACGGSFTPFEEVDALEEQEEKEASEADLRFGAIRFIDYSTGKLLFLLKGHRDIPVSLTFNPYGNLLISGDQKGNIRIWDLEQPGKDTIVSTSFLTEIEGLTVHPEGGQFACFTNGGIIALYSLPEGKKIAEKQISPSTEISDLEYHPEGDYLATLSEDGLLRIWDPMDLGPRESLFQTDPKNLLTWSMEFIDEHRLLLEGHDTTFIEGRLFQRLSVLTPATGEEKKIYSTENSIRRMRTSRDGAIICTLEHTNRDEVKVITAEGFHERSILHGAGEEIYQLAFGSDKEDLIWGTNQYNKNNRTTYGYEDEEAFQYRFSLKSKQVFSFPEPIRKDSKESFYPPLHRFGSITLSHQDNTLFIGEKKVELEDDIFSYTFSPDGTAVYAACWVDMFVIDTDRGEVIGSFPEAEGGIRSIAVSPDGSTLLSGGMDQTLRLWDTVSRELLLSIFISEDKEWIAWTPEGFYDSSLKGGRYAGWHFNRGESNEAEFFYLEQYRSIFYRPDIIEKALAREQYILPERIHFDTKPPVLSSLKAGNTQIRSENTVIETEDLFFDLEVEGEGKNPLKGIEIFVNGRVAAQRFHKGIGEVSFKQENRRMKGKFTFWLTKEITRFKVYLEDQRGFASREHWITVRYTGDEEIAPSYFSQHSRVPYPSPRGTLHCISIGIDDYGLLVEKAGLEDLRFAEKDAEEITSLFTRLEQKLFQKVSTSLLASSVLGRPVTAKDVEEALQKVEAVLKPEDRILVFLSGHGLEMEGAYYFLLSQSDPRDQGSLRRTALSWEWLGEKLKNLHAEEVLVIADACQSGAVSAGELGYKWKDKGIILLTSSKAGEKSFESPEWGHGAFTKSLVDGFIRVNRFTPADTSGDDVLLIGEIMDYAVKEVGDLTGHMQTPWMPEYDPSLGGRIMGVALDPIY